MLSPEQLTAINVLNDEPGDNTLWTRVNVGEATPGTVSPLTAEFQRPANTWPAARMFHRMGLLARPEIPGNTDPRHATTRFFFGKIAISLDFLRWLADRTPGTSGDAFEAAILGSVRPGVKSKPDHSRFPIAFAKIAWLLARLPKENKHVARETAAWWRDAIADAKTADIKRAAELFADARARFERIIDHAGLLAILSPAVLSQLSPATLKLGTNEDLLHIASGYGAIKEADMLEKVWAVAKGRMRLSTFLDEFGYMCPGGGELESLAWREDLTTLEPLLNTYRSEGRNESPRAKRELATARAKETQAILLARAKGALRYQLKFGLWLAQRILPLREVGKACMFMGCDAARAAARRLGRLLAAKGVLSDPEDVFYLTFDEIVMAESMSAAIRSEIADRRALRVAYADMELPDFFTSAELKEFAWKHAASDLSGVAGRKLPVARTADAIESFVIFGASASAGRVTGRARVIRDPRRVGDFRRGDILVCQVTDPGWSALFSIAGALVADVGGMLSHSAIIARELGVPAVVNTRDGTKRIPDGATITVDGAAGTVTVHDRRVDVMQSG